MQLNTDAHLPYKSSWGPTPKFVDEWLAKQLTEGYMLHSYNGSASAPGMISSGMIRVYAVVKYDPKGAAALIAECNQP